MDNPLHMLLQAVQVFLILVRAASQPVNIGSTVRDYMIFIKICPFSPGTIAVIVTGWVQGASGSTNTMRLLKVGL